jgi:hypothetical protein
MCAGQDLLTVLFEDGQQHGSSQQVILAGQVTQQLEGVCTVTAVNTAFSDALLFKMKTVQSCIA